MRALVALALLLAVCTAITVPPVAGAQSGGDPPTELWKEYPLDETAPGIPPDADTRVGEVPQARPVLGGDDGGGGSAAGPVALALLALAAAAGTLLMVGRVRSRRAAGATAVATAGELARERSRGWRRREPPLAAAKPPALPGPKPPSAKPAAPGPRAAKPQASLLTSSPAPPAALPPASAAASQPVANGTSRGPALGYTMVAAPGEAERARLREEAKVIKAACQEHGLVLGKLVRDLESNSGPELRRPGLSYVLEQLAAGEYECLIVSRLDRLTRSAANLGVLLRILGETGARLIVIDIGLDTGTDDGKVAAEALVTVGGLDEKKLEERTRKGLEAARSARRTSGRPAVADRPSLKQRIVDMRASGMTLQAIADTLNAEGVPTVRGGAKWRPSSVQAAAGYKRPKAGRERGESA